MAQYDFVNYGKWTKRDRLNLLRGELKVERTPFENKWRDLGSFIQPERVRFETTDVNKGIQSANKILDRTGTFAADILMAGITGGLTNPSRRWKRLTLEDKDLVEIPEVKEWLYTVDTRMDAVMRRSNMYTVLPGNYLDAGVFGTAACIVEEDFDTVFRMRELPVGSFWISENERGEIDIFMQEFQMTVRQLVMKFGKRLPNGDFDWSNFSRRVVDAWKGHRWEEWVEVYHFILPNEDYLEDMPGYRGKKYASLYYESGRDDSSNYTGRLLSGQEDLFLRRSGYDYFPVLAPRWGKTGMDAYGNRCPGIISLPDIKQLQTMQKRKLQAIEKMVNPPVQAPPEMRSSVVSLLGGGITFLKNNQGQKVEPIHQVNPQVQEIEMSMNETRNRINEAFMKNLFLMMATTDRREITAEEVRERSQEKMVVLGPALQRFDTDYLTPLIDIVFTLMDRQGLIPEPPEVIQGQPIKVEYVSVLAQAQKLMNLVGMERFVGFVGQLGAIDEGSLDKLDADQLIDEYAETIGTPPSVVRSDEDVAEMRAAQLEAQRAAAMIEAAPQIGKAAKDLSQASVEGENALTEMVGG